MTIRQMKELLSRVEAAGVSEDAQIYTQQERTNDADCFVTVRDKKGTLLYVYLSDASPDTLVMDLEDSEYQTEIIY